MRCFLYLVFICTLSASKVDAGAWTLPEGSAQAIVTVSYSFASDSFDERGDPVAVEPFTKFELRGYAEYGLTNWATVVIQPELRLKEQGDENARGLGRLDVGLRTRIWRSDFAVASLEASISAPGQSDELVPLNGGDTDWEVEARGLYGRGFDLGWRHGFIDLQLGYRHRFSKPADEIVFDATLGLDVTERSFAMVQSFNRLSVGSAQLPFSKTREHKIALSNVLKVTDKWSLQTGVQTTVLGENVLREQGAFLSVWRAF